MDKILHLFKKELVDNYDFTDVPGLVRSKKSMRQASGFLSDESYNKWGSEQKAFISWTSDEEVFEEKYVLGGWRTIDKYFKKRGLLEGDVLDVGGGWGLYRQWWKYREGNIFIIHDPGLDRFLHGPYEVHKKIFARAFFLPSTFVEGFGEVLPYCDQLFDTCIISATLDHCSRPDLVMREAFRILKEGGVLLVMQTCKQAARGWRGNLNRILRSGKLLFTPLVLMSKFKKRNKLTDRHLHHFKPGDIIEYLNCAGFGNVKESPLSRADKFYVFKAEKRTSV